MKLSLFGQKFAGRIGGGSDAGIVSLMEDLGEALRVNPDMLFMGGGNPAHIAEVEAVFERHLQALVADSDARRKMLGIYQPPQGEPQLLKQLAELLRREYGWNLSAKNIAISNGSQAAFFVLFNLFGGRAADGSDKIIQLPLAPEYLGYTDVGVDGPLFCATRPQIELIGEHMFKYRVDFDSLEIADNCAALCVSRPTNPTGNVLTDEEMAKLCELAQTADIPLIIDGAYGTPFPNIIFSKAEPLWNEQCIVVLSLSKLGLPGVRTGIVIACEEVIRAFTNANTILNLACGNLGPALAERLAASGELIELGRQSVKPFYQARAEKALAWFEQYFQGLPWRVHKPEGAIFLWLWFKGLPCSSEILYQRLKARGLLVVSGHHFFPGLDDYWDHAHECIRVNYSQSSKVVERGIALIGEEVRAIFAEG